MSEEPATVLMPRRIADRVEISAYTGDYKKKF